MREGYGKSKLFFLVVICLVSILLMPYRLKGNETAGGSEENRQPESALDEDKVPEEAEFESMVSVTVKNKQTNAVLAEGGGVIWKSDKSGMWIVTAAHVLEQAGDGMEVQIGLIGGNGKYDVVSQSFCISKTADLAFLRVENSEARKAVLREGGGEGSVNVTAAAVKLPGKDSYDLLKEGDIVSIRGYESGKSVEFDGTLLDAWIYVEDFEQYMMTARCRIVPGLSGCGLYDESGVLIGIVCGGNEESIVTAVPLHVIQAEFDNMKADS